MQQLQRQQCNKISGNNVRVNRKCEIEDGGLQTGNEYILASRLNGKVITTILYRLRNSHHLAFPTSAYEGQHSP